MNQSKKTNDVRKSALWALISFPITFIFIGALVHGGGILEVFYIPFIIVYALLAPFKGLPEWLFWAVALIAQYLGYFLFIYVLIKIIRVLKNTRAENIVNEQPEEDPTDIWDLFHDGTLINAQENTPGNLLLTIELEYVREEFDEDFKYFLLELHECSLFEYYPSVWDIEIIKDIQPINDIKSILKYDLWMTDVEKKNDQIIVYCSNGILKTKYRDYSISLDTGKKVSKDDLIIKENEAVKKALNSRKNYSDK